MKNVVSINSSEETLSLDESADLSAAARDLGLRQVRAWVPDKNKKAHSAGAERTKRSREKAAQQGKKQLSITLPAELHEPVKALAARIRAGEPPDLVWADLARGYNQIPASASLPSAPTKLMGWRRWLLLWLLPTDLRTLIG